MWNIIGWISFICAIVEHKNTEISDHFVIVGLLCFVLQLLTDINEKLDK